MTKPIISVIIPAYNEENEIRNCLDSLMKQTLAKKFFEIIVVDNASTDKTAAMVKEYPVRYLKEAKRSVVVARQTGVNASYGSIIVSADADTTYPSDWLLEIEKVFRKKPDLIAVVGWMYYRRTPVFYNILTGFYQRINHFISQHDKKFPIAYAANFAFKKSALLKIGGYPAHLPELGDQQYLLFKFFRIGKVSVEPSIYCFTSGRQFHSMGKNLFRYNGWHRIIGYLVNSLFVKEVIGPKPAIRTTQSRKSRSSRRIF